MAINLRTALSNKIVITMIAIAVIMLAEVQVAKSDCNPVALAVCLPAITDPNTPAAPECWFLRSAPVDHRGESRYLFSSQF
ncbi:hypothetical protein AG4045_017951 [Apium graveolens]|uniref:Bifunctional inhibitor/plant lipid transfer protein/seed storage helical domain-containing protein n=1 Tax=Apium graveolens TaxID=4045 RepID=A0A6L5BF06_APIGR|nr:hypothetical protein AG4045_017951 [Apium graveolens]